MGRCWKSLTPGRYKTLGHCWFDAGPTSKTTDRHRPSINWVAYASRTCWTIFSQQTWSVGPVLFWCWAGVADGGPALNRYWVSGSSLLVHLLFSCMLYNVSHSTFRPMQVYIRPVLCGVYNRIFYFKRTLSPAFCWFRVGPDLATLTQLWTGGGRKKWRPASQKTSKDD